MNRKSLPSDIAFTRRMPEFQLSTLQRICAAILFINGVAASLPLFMTPLPIAPFVLRVLAVGSSWMSAVLVDAPSPFIQFSRVTAIPRFTFAIEIRAAILVSALFIPAGILLHGARTASNAGDFRIVVADFSAPDGAYPSMRSDLIHRIQSETSNQPGIRIIALRKSPAAGTGKDSAAMLIRRYGADLLVRGSYRRTGTGMSFFMNLRHPSLHVRVDEIRRRIHPLMRPPACSLPGHFTLHSNGQHNWREMAHFISGLAHFLRHRPRRAVQEWNTARRFASDSTKGWITLFRGNAHLALMRLDQAEMDTAEAISRLPRLAHAWNQRGVIAALKHDAETAAWCLEQAAVFNPSWAEPHCNRGILLTKVKKTDDAAFAFTTALERDPKHCDSLYNQGIIAMTKKKWLPAAHIFTRLIRVQPLAGDAWYQRGICHFKKNNRAAAHSDLTHAVRLRPNWPSALHDLGVVHARNGNIFMAIRSFTRALALKPGRIDSRRQLAAALYSCRDFSRAAREYSRILRADPLDATALTDRGRALFRVGNIPAAVNDFSLLIDRFTDNPEPLILRGRVYLEADQAEAAEKDFANALSLDAEDPHAWAGRAMARVMQQRFAEAIADLEHALARKNDNPHWWLLAGLIHRRMHQYGPAEDHLRKASALSPGSAEPTFELGVTLFLAGKNQSALEQFNQVLHILPDHHQALHFRGNLYLQSGNTTAAADDFRAALKLVPQEAAYYLSLANAHLISGKTESAVKQYLAGAKLLPGDPTPVLFAGQALEEAGRPHAALELYRKTLEKGPRSAGPCFQALKRRIAELETDLKRLQQGKPAANGETRR